MAADRGALAAALWAVLSLILWNVLFDRGVELTAFRYLASRAAYLNGHAARVELAPAMRAGIGSAARRASILTAPCLAVCLGLLARAPRLRRWFPTSPAAPRSSGARRAGRPRRSGGSAH